MGLREQLWGVKAATKPGVQRNLAEVVTWGGRRRGSGRKAGARPKVRHRARPEHVGTSPVHVTMRRAAGLPSLRSERLHNLLRAAIGATRREGFRIVHYSVQADHVHLVIEADDATTLMNGMRSFAVRVAMRVNRQVFRRRGGRVWGDRYHTKELTCPKEVRNTLVYVLKNHVKHGEQNVGAVDPCSSGPWWDGWMQVFESPSDPSSVQAPTTWLLLRGWRGRNGFGFIHLGEVPRAARARRRRRLSASRGTSARRS